MNATGKRAQDLLSIGASLLIAGCSGGASGGGNSTPAPPAQYEVGGSIGGLHAAGLVLEDNGADDLSVGPGATTFTFATPMVSGAPYAVTVFQHPTGQTCAVANGSGSVGTAPVTTVAVTCSDNAYTVSGSIGGLTAGGLVLQDNGRDNLPVGAGATAFTFATPVAYGAAYAVTVLTQPTGLTCTVNSGSGTMGAANVTGVSVVCSARAFTVGGTVSGLTSSGLVLQDNGGDNLPVGAGASTFTFATPVAYGAAYAVTVFTQPAGLTCTVNSGSGTMGAANVTGVSVVCSASAFTVGGTLSGLTAGGLVLQDNGGDNLPVGAGAATFTFATPVAVGAPYAVSVLTQPTGLNCAVANGSGTMGAANVANVGVTCAIGAPLAPTFPQATATGSGVQVTWTASSGAATYNVYYGTVSGAGTASANVKSTASTSVTVTGLTVGTRYYFVVTAVNGGGESPASGEVSAVPTASTWFSVAAANTHTLALKPDHTLWAWGWNYYGQLGIGATSPATCNGQPCALSPVQVGSAADWAAVFTGGYASLALKSDGTLWAWGYNSQGELGIGSTSPSTCSGVPCALSPVQVGSASTWSAAAVGRGGDYSVAVKNDGTLWAWGNDGSGSGSQFSPLQVGSVTTWTTVAAGSVALALRNDDSAWVWGTGTFGELGNGYCATYLVQYPYGYTSYSPIAVTTASPVSQVAAGGIHALALLTNGTLYAWGDNQYGELGVGSGYSGLCGSFGYPSMLYPYPVAGSTWARVAAGGNQTLAIQTDGTLWAWGDNSSGQLGTGNTTPQNTPVQVGSLNTWAAITAGAAHALALKNDGTLWAFGSNSYGQLGNGSTVNSSSPVQVP